MKNNDIKLEADRLFDSFYSSHAIAVKDRAGSLQTPYKSGKIEMRVKEYQSIKCAIKCCTEKSNSLSRIWEKIKGEHEEALDILEEEMALNQAIKQELENRLG